MEFIFPDVSTSTICTVPQAYDSSDGADYRGSRKVTVGLLSGSVLPLWAALEKTVVACRAEMTKAEEALKASETGLTAEPRRAIGSTYISYMPASALPFVELV